MLFVGIDLAERHSAAVVIDGSHNPLVEKYIDTGSVDKKEHPWKRFRAYRDWTCEILKEVENLTEPPYVTFGIEEPYPHAVNVAPSYRMQGAVLAELQDWDAVEGNVIITKSKPWQDHFGYTKKEFGSSKAWAKLMCEGFDYEPGGTVDGRVLAKPKEDLRDAYLIARWLTEV